jgi:hypothetical protein
MINIEVCYKGEEFMAKRNIQQRSFFQICMLLLTISLTLGSTTAYAYSGDTTKTVSMKTQQPMYNGTMSIQDTTAKAGEKNVIVEITGEWPVALGAYTMCLKYDPAVLELVTVSFIGTIGESADFITIWGSDEPGNVTAGAIWCYGSAQPGSGVLFKVVFNISTSAQSGETLLDLREYLKPQQVTKYVQPPGYGITPDLYDGVLTIEKQDACGDVDKNGILNISDAVFIISYIFGGGPAPEPLCLGDIDGNGFISISDAVAIINYIFGEGPAPRQPHDCLCTVN